VKKIYFLTIIVLCFFTLNVFAQAGGMRAATVNSDVILRELPEAQKASKELEATVKVWQDSLERMQSEFQRGLEEYQKKRDIMQPSAKDARERELAEQQQRIREYSYQKFDQRQGEAILLREKKLAPIQEKILKVIEDIAKEQKYNYVFDKATTAIVLYSDPKHDLTYDVINRLKRGK
jgi:Skp family chaperone for outer membrane proteins